MTQMPKMKDGLRQRSPGSWEIKYDAGRDPITGARRVRFKTVKGTRRDAMRERRRLLSQVDQGVDADANRLSLGQDLDQWLTGHRATVVPRTAERYGEHIEKHIRPILGNVQLAKLTTLKL